ncbi:CPBP family intramembrane metalloprotease [Bacillus aquiflavi]|uniref:CPBP family intramembrane metalloprotease n=1 Tax=Bacillus aquiflavi TaxID=2672567 RepID=A0A6B3VTJ3_9BACI|nr:type II CAAX endopeptidase family protein [Bacillus aquiflavi]MBA4537333.1 CPBP family intramembrane metalloprotease [Bacillus aquiflavi]NEY81590.1 CPBP family intramembrane metalloprotease [Bacillus aquiflavi]UAC47106.1 CPBP family intramembrane metalloprotease [Bacillus aquiflavi]
MKKRQLDLIKQLSEKELLFHLYATQILLLAVSFFLCMILFGNFSAFFSIFVWDDPQILYIGGGAGLAVVIIDIVLMRLLPSDYYDDGGLNKKVFQNRATIHIAFIAVIVAFSEEILFRGMIQTHFGLVAASLIFAGVHFRYLFNWFLFVNITVLSFFIGLIYEWTENLLVTIFMHFIIDFLLGLLIKIKSEKKQVIGRDVNE